MKKQFSFRLLFFGIGIFFWHTSQCSEFILGKYRDLKKESLKQELQTVVRPV